jgi:integrase
MVTCGGAQVALQQSLILRPGNKQCTKNLRRVGQISTISTGHFVVFIPKKLADRLKDYLKARGAEGSQRIFPITYTAARVMLKKAGALLGVHLRPHDLRRHAAT